MAITDTTTNIPPAPKSPEQTATEGGWIGSQNAEGKPVGALGIYQAGLKNGTVTPTVTTANAAQTDYNNKQADFTGQLKNIQDQNTKLQADANQKAINDAQAKQTQFAQQQQQAELNLKQQDQNNKANAITVASGVTKPSSTPTIPYEQAVQAMNNQHFATAAEKTQAQTTLNKLYGVTPTTAPSATPTKPVDPVQQKLNDTNTQIESAYNDYKTQIDQIRNGTIPLSSDEQAILTSTQNAYDQAKQTQQLANKAYVQSTQQSAFRSGQSEYAPEIGAGTIAAAITYGVQKIAELDGQAAKAISELKQGFMDKDYKYINDSYDKYNNILKDRKTELVKMQDTAYSHAKDERDYALELTKIKNDQAYKKSELAIKVSELAIQRERLHMQKSGTIDMNGNPIFKTPPQTNLKSSDINPTSGLSYNTEARIASLPPATATTIRSLLNYSANPANISTRKDQREQMLTLAHAADPTFDESQYEARSKYNNNLSSGQLSQAVTSANKSISHLLSFADTVTKLPNNTPSSSLNRGIQNFESMFSGNVQTNQKQAQTEANGVKDELAKFFKGTGSTDVKSIDDWSKSLDTGQNHNQLKGTVQGAINLMAGQLDTLQTQYQNTMGKPAGDRFLQPDTVAKLSQLKNEGYKVNIPGVYYTDKNAYIKNGGNQSSLDSAYQTLKANGIEATPENILQAAQLQ